MTIPRRSFPRRLAAPLVLWLVSAAAAAEPIPLGPAIHTPFGQCPELAGRPDGTFAAAWMGFLAPDREIVQVQTGAELGNALGSQFTVDFEAEGLFAGGTAIAATAGGYTVVWRVVKPDRFPHFALTTDLAGMPLDEPQDLHRQSLELSPRPVGGFVSHWTGLYGDTVSVQLIDAAGRETSRSVRQPARNAAWTGVAHRSNGDFVVYWHEQTPRFPHRNAGVSGRRFDALGRPVGKVFRLMPPGGAPPFHGSFRPFRLAVGEDGRMAAVWVFGPAEEEVGRAGLRARLFDRRGTPLGPTHELMGAPGNPELLFFPGGVAVDAEGRALATGVEIEGRINGEPTRARALALTKWGTADGEPFDFTGGTDGTFCSDAAAVGDAWLVVWRSITEHATFLRPFSR